LPVAVVFLLRAVVLVLLWGFVVAAIVAVRHDVFGTRPTKQKRGGGVTAPPRPSKPPPAPKPSRKKPSRAVASQVAVVEGPAAGTTVALGSAPVTIGRAPTSGVVLPDDYVSSNHARLVPQGQDWLVEDSGSTNGTYVNDRKVNSPVVVPVGGRITIGRNVLELRA
jgi:pSer/pThr/pTyr-binding forkhead associated (FHA) protein